MQKSPKLKLIIKCNVKAHLLVFTFKNISIIMYSNLRKKHYRYKKLLTFRGAEYEACGAIIHNQTIYK